MEQFDLRNGEISTGRVIGKQYCHINRPNKTPNINRDSRDKVRQVPLVPAVPPTAKRGLEAGQTGHTPLVCPDVPSHTMPRLWRRSEKVSRMAKCIDLNHPLIGSGFNGWWNGSLSGDRESGERGARSVTRQLNVESKPAMGTQRNGEFNHE